MLGVSPRINESCVFRTSASCQVACLVPAPRIFVATEEELLGCDVVKAPVRTPALARARRISSASFAAPPLSFAVPSPSRQLSSSFMFVVLRGYHIIIMKIVDV